MSASTATALETLLRRTFVDFQQTEDFLLNPLIVNRAEGLYYWDRWVIYFAQVAHNPTIGCGQVRPIGIAVYAGQPKQEH